VKTSLKFKTLESRIYFIFTILIFATIFIMQLVSFRFSLSTVRNSTLGNSRVLQMQLTNQIDSYIQSMEHIALTVSDDESLLHLLQNYSHSASDEADAFSQKLFHYVQARDDISDILVTGSDNLLISSDPDLIINPWADIHNRQWYLDAVDACGDIAVSTSYVQNLKKDFYSWVVSLSREIKNGDDTLGVMLVDLKFNRIKELCQALVVGQKGYNFILDRHGNYVFHPFQQLVYSNLRKEPIQNVLRLLESDAQDTYFDGESYFMIRESVKTGWYVVSVIHDSDIITDWRYVQITYTLIGFLIFLSVGLATNRISSGITLPVRKLQDVMKSVDTGEFRLVGEIRATEEIRELAREYDITVGRIRELMRANMQEQEQKRKSDLKALQAQINPHFLYNTLDSIIWMGEMGQNREVVQMTSALSKLFRISISKGQEIISLHDEISHVQSYLTIQKMRYRDKFKYHIDIDPDLYHYTLLKITLQPLVENAIYHGIKETDHEGFIRITGREEDGCLVLQVSDNGLGMSSEQLKEMIKGIENVPDESPSMSRQGMGVRNVHQRIRLYFGMGFGLTFISSPGNGTTITVRMPMVPRSKEHR